MNPRRKQVELRTSKHTTEDGALQKGEDFVKAFTLGFDVDDAIALLRLDDLYSKPNRIRQTEMKQELTSTQSRLSKSAMSSKSWATRPKAVLLVV